MKLKRKFHLTQDEKDDMRNQRQAAFDKMTPEQVADWWAGICHFMRGLIKWQEMNRYGKMIAYKHKLHHKHRLFFISSQAKLNSGFFVFLLDRGLPSCL